MVLAPMSLQSKTENAVKRFGEAFSVNQKTGCWEWNKTISDAGYGVYYLRGKANYAHRVSYKVFVGDIGDGLQIDHLCRNTKCMNPAHLEAVTPRENTLRSTSTSARHAKQTHCVRGHEFTPDNTYIAKHKYARRCKQCANIQASGYKKRHRKELAAKERDRKAKIKRLHV